MKVIELLSCLTFLAAITSAVEIQCFYREIPWGHIGLMYTCWMTVINVENPATVTAITGTHLAGKGNEDVKGIWMQDDSHQILTTIPKGIENFFANLVGFEWYNGNISTINSSTFEPFKNLLSIWLQNNKLVTLDGDLFQHTRKLREINVGGNLLQKVGHDLFTGLTDLTWAYFGGNPCINEEAYNQQQIEELKLQLTIQCPPLATTPDPPTTTISTTNEPNECPATCTSRLEEIERKIRDEINDRIEKLENFLRESTTPVSTTEWIEPDTSPITTRSTTAPPTTPRNPNDVTISFVCPDDGFGSIPNANFCSRYFECNRGIRFAKKCPAGQIFNVITSKCGDPDISLCALNIRCV